MNERIRKKRVPMELELIRNSEKSHGITCVVDPESGEDYRKLMATIPGPSDTPYEGTKYTVSIDLGDQYPFYPPTFKFITQIYHPNIDPYGTVCLDLLRSSPSGTYTPTITLESMLLSIQLLMVTPNPDHPLHAEAAKLYTSNRALYNVLTRNLAARLADPNLMYKRDEELGRKRNEAAQRGNPDVPEKKPKN